MENTIKTNTPSLLSNPLISLCEAEEADQKVIRHMIQCVQSGVKHVTIKTVDSDVVILAVANRHNAQNFDSKVDILFGVGTSTKHYDVNALSIGLGEDICILLCIFWL